MTRTRTLTAVGLALAAVLLSGAEGCQDQGGSRGAGPPPRVPTPNPDTGPNKPKTPNPKNADPAPNDPERQYTVWLTWTPAKNFIEIDWVIGSDNGPNFGALQRSGGKFSKNGTARRSATVMVFGTVYKGTEFYPIEIKCWITEDGIQVDHKSTVIYKSTTGMLGVSCEAPG